jgi:hypothetical protein
VDTAWRGIWPTYFQQKRDLPKRSLRMLLTWERLREVYDEMLDVDSIRLCHHLWIAPTVATEYFDTGFHSSAVLKTIYALHLVQRRASCPNNQLSVRDSRSNLFSIFDLVSYPWTYVRTGVQV